MSKFKTWALIYLALALGLVVVVNVAMPPPATKRVELAEFMSLLERGNIRGVEAPGARISVTLTDGRRFYTDIPNLAPEVARVLRDATVPVIVPAHDEDQPVWFATLISLMPVIVLVAIWIYSIRYIRRAMADEVSRVLRESQRSRVVGDT